VEIGVTLPIDPDLEAKPVNLVRDCTDAVREFGGVGVNLPRGRVPGLRGPAILLKERIVRPRLVT